MRNWPFAIVLLLVVLPMNAARAQDPVGDAFTQPPSAARPHVWWHWMNGNVDGDEALADIEWMDRQGIGGIHLFEAGLDAPQQIPALLPWMAPAWSAVLRSSVDSARKRGLDFTMTTAPGWSQTGAPFIRPENAMKKLVWSVTTIKRESGNSQLVKLPQPPSNAGPYHDLPGKDGSEPQFYRDVAVIAFPGSFTALRPSEFTATSDVNFAKLTDGLFADGQKFEATDSGKAWLLATFEEPATVRSVRVGLLGARGFGTPNPPLADLEASDDGIHFQKVVRMPATDSFVRTASFPAVSARHFRLVVRPDPAPGFMATLTYAPGARRIPMPPPATTFSLSEFALFATPAVNSAEEKSGFATAPDYYALDTVTDGASVDAAEVIDISDRLRGDGSIDWSPPTTQRWTILRFGMTLTGRRNNPAPAEATGLEVDKLSAPRVAAYIDRYAADYRAALNGTAGWNGLLSDSIESGPQNWTDDMPKKFRNRSGYSLTKWYPALAGYVVSSGKESDRFLFDFRTVIADLIAEAHYATIARRSRSLGLTYYAEALEDRRPQLGDDLYMRSFADIPAAAMWWFDPEVGPKATYVADVLGAASVAHVTGKHIVAAEALSTFGHPWALTPKAMRPAADLALVLGANRLMLHSSVHQATGGRSFPGMTMTPLLGHNFNRNEAWADMASGWVGYLSRTQAVLQQGRAETSFAWFIGEEAPVTGLFSDAEPQGVPQGFTFDFVSKPLLASAMTVRNGRLINKSGNAYEFLYLGSNASRMTLASLRRIEKMAKLGVRIAGTKPVRSPSLKDDALEFSALAERLWRRSNVKTSSSPEEAIAAFAITPRWAFNGGQIAVQQRILADQDIFFIVNRSTKPVSGTFSAKARKSIEWWNAVDGHKRQLTFSSADGQARVALRLQANESGFLVLRDIPSVNILPVTEFSPAATADETWVVRLSSPALIERTLSRFALGWLDQSSDPEVRYFSGTARYSGSVLTEPRCLGARSVLDLGAFGDVARVRINGAEAGIVWTTPAQLDVSKMLRPGRNELEIEVAISWVNRLIGNARRDPNSASGAIYAPDAPLRHAGLNGPVRLLDNCKDER